MVREKPRERGGCRCTGTTAGCCATCCPHKKNVLRIGTRIENSALFKYTMEKQFQSCEKKFQLPRNSCSNSACKSSNLNYDAENANSCNKELGRTNISEGTYPSIKELTLLRARVIAIPI